MHVVKLKSKQFYFFNEIQGISLFKVYIFTYILDNCGGFWDQKHLKIVLIME